VKRLRLADVNGHDLSSAKRKRTTEDDSMSRRVLAHHLIWTGYGHWLPNDPRGSGSCGVANDELADLGEIHYGRKVVQPSRAAVRQFYERADERLAHPRILFDDAQIETISLAFSGTVQRRHYTCYACAVLPDHVHLVIRAHRDKAETMICELQRSSRLALYDAGTVAFDHPVWTERGWKVFLYTPDEIRTRIQYVEQNPIKDGRPAQHWPFVTKYDGWPYHQARG
jgi:REP element-mobilizing transposase RayT